MKRSKFILSALLAGYLVATSCTETRDPSKDIKYDFKADVIFPETVTSGSKSLLYLKLNTVFMKTIRNLICFLQKEI